MSNTDRRLPIKVVVPNTTTDYYSVTRKPNQWPPFGDVTDDTRARLADQAAAVASHFAQSFPDWGAVPAVAKLTLIPEAVAKTYRPTAIFNDRTCPIIGTGDLGELYVSVTPQGIGRLANRIRSGESNQAVSHISTIQQIEPYSASPAPDAPATPDRVPAPRRRKRRLRCRMHQHPGPAGVAAESRFLAFAESKGASRVELMAYSPGLRIYCLHDVPPENEDEIRSYPNVESATAFPEYRVLRSTCSPQWQINADWFPPPEPGVEYGLVGQIDTGTDPNNHYLQAWVEDRFDYVPRDLQDNTHGSFVAGVAIHGRLMNHNHEHFPSVSSRIVDVVAIDRDGTIDEYDLITVIDAALDKYPAVRVWNLSLGQTITCTNQKVSPLGAALDQRMKKFDVIFVIAAGNLDRNTPLRRWPLEGYSVGEEDRICPPADAQRGLTIAGLAHLDNANTCVQRGEPSPFSRRGPAVAFATKPEIAFPAGNCDARHGFAQTGVLSVDAGVNISESVGTSYAAPLASSLVANLVNELSVDGEVAPVPLAKAMTIHSAFLRQGPPDTEGLRHRGVGCPLDLPDILHCRQSAATIIFQVPLTPKPSFAKRHFPIPPCLIDPERGLRCEVFMTLYYDPPLDAAFDFEYCRSNIEASLGTMRLRKPKQGQPGEPKDGLNGEMRLVPLGIKKAYPNEAEQVEHGFKWSPLKLYYRKFVRGPKALRWELRLDMLNRAEHVLTAPITAYLIVTIAAFAPGAKVYDEMVREMSLLGWAAADLRVRSRERTAN